MATPNVDFLGHLPRNELREHLQRARALVFAAEEDFGILPVEAQACGTPVIALGRGGVTETVIAPPAPAPTGLFFPAARIECIAEAVARFERSEQIFRPENSRAQALRFSAERFRSEFRQLVESTNAGMAAPSLDARRTTQAADCRGAG
jgi:glycosyltransferase involved in cell wall biosynthesis